VHKNSGFGQIVSNASLKSRETTYPLQHIVPVVTKLHEQGDFPAGVTVDSIHLWGEAESRGQMQHKIMHLRHADRNNVNEPVPPLCSQGYLTAQCYWHEGAVRHSLASAPPCLQPPP